MNVIKRVFNEFFAKNKLSSSRFSDTELVKTEDGITIEVIRTAYRHFYDSNWCIRVKKNDAEFIVSDIVRYDYETAVRLEKKIRELSPINESTILSLNLKSQIYYD